jgi:hypothetical protein
METGMLRALGSSLLQKTLPLEKFERQSFE